MKPYPFRVFITPDLIIPVNHPYHMSLTFSILAAPASAINSAIKAALVINRSTKNG